MPEEIQTRIIEQEMKESYLDYAMSVIMSRALPDVRDGLKPVHRRILYAMHNMGMHFNKPFKKCARIVGETMGKYHPHGDSAIYDALVRMAQDFSLRYPLIDGQGNFGSVDGDEQAAMRYTEARLQKLADELLKDIDKETVPFRPNFDDSLEEPQVLPALLPNLLINGSSGIAVGMATNIPPHNLTEVANAAIAYIKNHNISVDELMDYVQAPDFPTGANICGLSGVKTAYKTGKGKIIVKATTHIEDNKIVVTEIPYMLNKSVLIENIASLVKNGIINDIADIRDESDRTGMRIVFILKRGSDPQLVMNQLMNKSQLRTSYGINMLAVNKGKPEVMTLKDIIKHYVTHRKEVVTKRTEYNLKKSEEKAHILSGLIVALDHIDPVVQAIKQANSAEAARVVLMKTYELSEIQAQAILDMRLQRLTSLETSKIKTDYDATLKDITNYKEILASEQKIFTILTEDLEMIKQKYGDERKTTIIGEETIITDEDLIKEEQVVINVTHSGYIKQMPLHTYKQQRRGGKGVQGAKLKEEDLISNIFVTSNLHYLLFFSNKGKVYWLKTYQLPSGSRYSKGGAIVNLLHLEQGEKITAVLPVRDFNPGHSIVFATARGMIKKTSLGDYSKPRKVGIRAIGLTEKDTVVSVQLTSGNETLVLATQQGNAVKFHETDVRNMGRSAGGVRGVTLQENDAVVGMEKCSEENTIFTITENGFGKRTKLDDYRLIHRGGKGVRNIITSPRNGKVVDILVVQDTDELILVSEKGIVIRINAKDVSTIGRNTQGLRIMKLADGDKVVSITKIAEEE